MNENKNYQQIDDNNKENLNDEQSEEKEVRTAADFSRPCPVCGESIPMNEKVCPYCGYYESAKEGGYKPLSKIQTRKIKTILFFALMAVAIVVYILLRKG